MKKNRNHALLRLLSLIALYVCLATAGPAQAAGQKAAVHVIASDYSSAAQAVIDVNPIGGPRAKQLDLFAQPSSNWIIRSYGDYFYLIGRYYTDSLTKFSINAPTTPIYQESVLAGGSASSNPHDLIFVSANKAYMPMYGLNVCWIIDPKTGKKTGEIDLSAYADSDGLPEMHTGVIVGDKLFLLVQRHDRDNNWAPSNDSYVAVIDTTTDTEINTTGNQDPALKGIKLTSRNPQSIQYLPENNTIYIASVGKYPGTDPGSPYLYTGGVETINPDTFDTNLLVDDGPDGPSGSHPYGAISRVMVVSPTKGYFIGYMGWGDNALFTFNPTTGDVEQNTILNGLNLTISEKGAPVDENGMLWLSVGGTEHTLYIINTADDSVDEKVDTNLNPNNVAFCPQTIWPGSNATNSGTGTGTIKVEISHGNLAEVKAYTEDDFPNAGNKPEDKTFIDGLIGLTVDGLANGATVEATVTFPTKRPDDAVYYKINASGDFEEFDSNLIQILDDYTIILTLTDGGAGDSDGQANGVIVDPGGWAGTAEPDLPSGGGGSGGGSGCFVNSL